MRAALIGLLAALPWVAGGATPVLLARAVGPFFAAWLLLAMGGYFPMTLALAAIGLVAWAAFAAAVHVNRR